MSIGKRKSVVAQELQVGRSEVSRSRAVHTLSSDRRFASLSETRGKRPGWYWIGTEEMRPFIDPNDPNHRFYVENESGTYSRVSKSDYYDAKTPRKKRLYITYPAANRVLNNDGPVILCVGVIRADERLYILASGKPTHNARVASMPKARKQ